MWEYTYTDKLYHHGIKGQKWGVRRYQNLDGTLTEAGKKRLYKDVKKAYKHDNWDYGYKHDKVLRRNKLISGIHESLKEKRAAYEEADYLSRQFHSDTELVRKYTKRADSKKMYWEDTMDSYPDGQAFRLYLQDKGIDYEVYLKNANEAYSNYWNECRKLVDTMLGDMGNMPVNKISSDYNIKYSSAVRGALLNRAADEWNAKYLRSHGYEY